MDLRWPLLLGPLAVLAVGIVSWIVQAWIFKKRATIDFISRNEIASPEWQKAIRRFMHLRRAEDGLIELAGSELNDRQLKDRLLVIYLLRHCEVVAVGIRRGAFNGKIYKDWNRSRYVKTWNDAQGFIGAYRAQENQPTAFVCFEKLAQQWADDD